MWRFQSDDLLEDVEKTVIRKSDESFDEALTKR